MEEPWERTAVHLFVVTRARGAATPRWLASTLLLAGLLILPATVSSVSIAPPAKIHAALGSVPVGIGAPGVPQSSGVVTRSGCHDGPLVLASCGVPAGTGPPANASTPSWLNVTRGIS